MDYIKLEWDNLQKDATNIVIPMDYLAIRLAIAVAINDSSAKRELVALMGFQHDANENMGVSFAINQLIGKIEDELNKHSYIDSLPLRYEFAWEFVKSLQKPKTEYKIGQEIEYLIGYEGKSGFDNGIISGETPTSFVIDLYDLNYEICVKKNLMDKLIRLKENQ